jgi:hypothetical protein
VKEWKTIEKRERASEKRERMFEMVGEVMIVNMKG